MKNLFKVAQPKELLELGLKKKIVIIFIVFIVLIFSVVFFIMAIIVCPIGFLIGTIGAIIFFRKNKK